MPIFSATSGQFGFGFTFQTASSTPAALPSYYTSSTDYVLANSNTGPRRFTLFRNTVYPPTITPIRQYSTIGTNVSLSIINDRDLDTNIYYDFTRNSLATAYMVNKWTLQKGTAVATSTLIAAITPITSCNINATTTYVPACMWDTLSYGALALPMRNLQTNQGTVSIAEFNSTKSAITSFYDLFSLTADYQWINGLAMIPKQASGFSQHYAVAQRASGGTPLEIVSWAVNMDTKTWTVGSKTNWVSGTSGPFIGYPTIYYPIGKPAYVGDSNGDPNYTDTTTNRIVLTDPTGGVANIYIWTITEVNSSLVFTFKIKITIGYYTNYEPLTPNSYNSIA